jgi:hypothetical protein
MKQAVLIPFGDYKDRASYTSLGAAIENFVIAASHKSYDTRC